ncbi:hypothetical protein CXG81DRAFT_10697 [Caulochytrium protostelioides]|uniref:Leucine carboxyl methyltransferase 1 n=1 Tax=Caulochytrium protostelioides TaxID=1555241 RepID=A0A4P9XAZ6_9FUNG|nr:hypothetical protein CXG81DRAFT_10697 [Caulochytrium protostelioides]|eukprot:RKP02532.1 hypothetical protein CXG81DRAFT_10697 [Caulochytrium protostelioides]
MDPCHTVPLSQDEAVQGTNDDAAISRASAVTAGYMEDPYAKVFVKRPPRKPPLINRGTYTRTLVLDQLMDAFVARFHAEAPATPVQIVSLGAGSDTRFFRRAATWPQPFLYYEIDFPQITGRKGQTVARNRATAAHLPDYHVECGGLDLHTETYHLVSGDLRQWAAEIVPKLVAHGFDPARPTVYLSECVLVYMDAADANAILDWVTANAGTRAAFVVYEQIRPHDAFGQQMLANLQQRHLALPGLLGCDDLAAQQARFAERGWATVEALDMRQAWERLVPAEEKARVAKLEIFDEVEEWHLLMEHYAIVHAEYQR